MFSAYLGLELGCTGTLMSLFLFKLVFFLRSQFNHSLQYSLLETEIFHCHIVHHFYVFLQQPVQVLDQATTCRLLSKCLPVLGSVAGGGPIV